MVDLLTLTYRWNLVVKLRWGDKLCAIFKYVAVSRNDASNRRTYSHY